MTRIVFIRVQEKFSKLEKLYQIAYKHFFQKQPLLFLISDPVALEFLDQFFWDTPPHSFLPHPTPLLSIELSVIENYPYIFNLSPKPILKVEEINTIYELEDHTSPERLRQSQEKHKCYEERVPHCLEKRGGY